MCGYVYINIVFHASSTAQDGLCVNILINSAVFTSVDVTTDRKTFRNSYIILDVHIYVHKCIIVVAQ